VSIAKEGLDTMIKDVHVNDRTTWRKKHQRTITQAYSKAPYGDAVVERISAVLADESLQRLAELNVAIITEITKMLGMPPNFLRSSDLKCAGKRSQHLLSICRRLGATSYLSPQGASTYLEEDGFIDWLDDVRLIHHRFYPQPYLQHRSEHFIPYLSIIDVIANLGVDGTLKYLREGCEG
jgi:hypothetical protein